MNRTAIVGLGLVALGLSACADDHRSTGGGSVEPGEKFAGLYVASGANSIARVDLNGNKVAEVQVGATPTRIARAGNRVYVTLRGERRVAVMEDSGDQLTTVGSIATGAEPYGIAATADRVYVASSVSGYVGEYDAVTFEQLRSWNIPGEPRWLTLHPSKKGLYVGSAYGGTLTHINLDSGVARAIALPDVQGFNFTDNTQQILTKRITSDVVSSPDGRNIYVGMLYVDNKSTIPDVTEGDPCGGGGDVPPPGGMVPPPRDGGGFDCGGGGYNSQKFNPVIDKVPVDQITSEPVTTEVPEAIQLAGGIQIEDSSGNPINFEAVSGYPAALAVTADNAMVFAAIEGAEAVLAMKVSQAPGFANPPVAMGGAARSPNGDAFPGVQVGGFSFRQIVSVKTGAAPRGIAIVGARAYVHAFFDQKVEEIDVDDVRDVFDFQNGGGSNTTVPVPPAKDVMGGIAVGSNGVPRQLVAKTPVTVSSDRIDPAFDEGRRLFYATNNPLMATVGAGVSCATCHFDLRTDGLTWTFQRGLRQTPNLSVNLAQTLPVGWAGNVATVADEGFNTSQKLMGGQNLTPEHTGAIQAFLYAAPEIDTPNKALASDAKVIRGAAVFANVGCVSCHSGPSHTDNKTYTMLGLQVVKTRPLSGIAASAPYFHDGSAITLTEVVERASRGEMGNAFTISVDDKAALVEYLKSL